VRARAAALLALLAVVAPPPAASGGGRGRPAVALAASPAHLTLVGRARRSLRVVNPGAAAVVVDASPAGFALGPRGRPRVLVGASARLVAAWLRIRPSRIALAPGAVAELELVATPTRAATPGDHAALVLFTTRAPPGTVVPVRMRVGITVVVRVPGRIVHALRLRSLRVLASARGRRVVRVVVANRGNVIEWLRRGRVEITVLAGARRAVRLRSSPRELLPGARAVFDFRYRASARGRVTAVASLAGPRAGGGTLRRSFRLPRARE
jgi:hypothetical protein